MWNIVQHDGPNHLETWLIPGWHRVVMGHMHGHTETLIAVLVRAVCPRCPFEVIRAIMLDDMAT